MHSVLKVPARLLAGAGLATALMFTAACDDDDDDPLVPPAPTELNLTSGNNQTLARSTVSAPMMVTLLDQFDDPMAGRTITWAVATGTGTLASTSSVTDADGEATMTFTSGATAGTVTITATITGLTPVTFTHTVQ